MYRFDLKLANSNYYIVERFQKLPYFRSGVIIVNLTGPQIISRQRLMFLLLWFCKDGEVQITTTGGNGVLRFLNK